MLITACIVLSGFTNRNHYENKKMILGEKSGFQGFEHCTLIIRAEIAKINRNFRPFSF